jgi:glycosyltransferase involved in cell wall biosynthesis
MILSILIPTLPERKHFLNEMLTNISEQIERNNAWDKFEVLIDERDKSFTTGYKRNDLLRKSKGKYVWFVDDDDYIWPYSIEEILNASQKNPDVIGINGIMTTDGSKQVDWEIRIGHPYKAVQKNGKEYYLRFPNHITPMKREHAVKVKFPDKFTFEDYEWAKTLNDAGYLKTQEIIEKPIYHYRCRTRK